MKLILSLFILLSANHVYAETVFICAKNMHEGTPRFFFYPEKNEACYGERDRGLNEVPYCVPDYDMMFNIISQKTGSEVVMYENADFVEFTIELQKPVNGAGAKAIQTLRIYDVDSNDPRIAAPDSFYKDYLSFSASGDFYNIKPKLSPFLKVFAEDTPFCMKEKLPVEY